MEKEDNRRTRTQLGLAANGSSRKLAVRRIFETCVEECRYEEQILLNYYPMYATGEYEHEKEIHLGPRYCDGTIGYKIITPLRRASGFVLTHFIFISF